MSMLSALDGLVFALESVIVSILALACNRLQVFCIIFHLTILEIEDDLAIFFTQPSNHEYDLKGCAERVSR